MLYESVSIYSYKERTIVKTENNDGLKVMPEGAQENVLRVESIEQALLLK